MADIKRILCATDFSECSDHACTHAANLAKEHGARLTMLHVIEYFPENRSNELVAPEDKDPKAFRKEKAMEALAQQATRINCQEARFTVSFSMHSASYEIIRYAAIEGVDLIVVATHAYKGMTALFGNTAEYVKKHAECEVVVVPNNGS